RSVFQASSKIKATSTELFVGSPAWQRYSDGLGSRSQIHGSPIAGDGRVLLSRRIESLTGRFAGVVVLWFDADDIVQLSAVEDERAVAVVTEDGQPLVVGPMIRRHLAANPLPVLAAGATEAWQNTVNAVTGEQALLMHRRLDSGVVLTVSGDKTAALEQWRASLRRNAFTFAVALIPFGTTVWLLLREIARQERKQRTAEEARRSELEATRTEVRRLALVARHTGSLIIITDPNGIIEWVNPAFSDTTGYSMSEAVGRSPGDLLRGPDSEPATRARMREGMSAGTGFHVETINYTKNRRAFWCEVDCTPVRGPSGAIEHFIAVAADVSRRKEQEARLEETLLREREANAMQRRFISMASHEFRTPLAIIDSTAQRLASTVDPPESRVVTRIGRIRAAVARMTEIIDRTLSSARLDEGRLECIREPFDLMELVADVVARQLELTPEFDIVVAARTSPAIIDGDPRLLEQVATNLVSNAIKYSGTARRIDISVTDGPDGVTLAIRDRGIGVASGEVGRLFTRYFRAHSAAAIPGTGIGLHLVKEIVTLHGGTVRADSKLGEGSVFKVTLPAAHAVNSRAA
ncbi:MAG: PAS domain-containing protein, partial [Alphaproteobacteria bacterium]|nr:PAS domain-containing protein [Alphaproteobacteria bacterium]